MRADSVPEFQGWFSTLSSTLDTLQVDIQDTLSSTLDTLQVDIKDTLSSTLDTLHVDIQDTLSSTLDTVQLDIQYTLSFTFDTSSCFRLIDKKNIFTPLFIYSFAFIYSFKDNLLNFRNVLMYFHS